MALHSKIGYQDNSPNNGHQAYMHNCMVVNLNSIIIELGLEKRHHDM